MGSSFTMSRPSYMPKYVPRTYKTLADTGIDTDEALDNVETGVDCDADATTAIPVGSLIRIEDEYMRVTATGTTLTVERPYPAAHLTNIDIYIVNKPACVLYLEGQQDPQSATIRDLSGYNNHGTITGATWVRLPSGLWVQSFDGTDDEVTGSFSPCSGLSAFWVGLWFKFTATIIDMTMYSEKIAGGATMLQLYASGGVAGKPIFWYSDNDSPTILIEPGINFNDGKWHFYEGARRATNSWEMLVDGVSRGTSSGNSGTLATNRTAIGRKAETAGTFFAGDVGIVRAINRNVPAAEGNQIRLQERHLFGV